MSGVIQPGSTFRVNAAALKSPVPRFAGRTPNKKLPLKQQGGFSLEQISAHGTLRDNASKKKATIQKKKTEKAVPSTLKRKTDLPHNERMQSTVKTSPLLQQFNALIQQSPHPNFRRPAFKKRNNSLGNISNANTEGNRLENLTTSTQKTLMPLDNQEDEVTPLRLRKKTNKKRITLSKLPEETVETSDVSLDSEEEHSDSEVNIRKQLFKSPKIKKSMKHLQQKNAKENKKQQEFLESASSEPELSNNAESEQPESEDEVDIPRRRHVKKRQRQVNSGNKDNKVGEVNQKSPKPPTHKKRDKIPIQETSPAVSSRGRILRKTMEWWRNERVVVTSEGQALVYEGSPSVKPKVDREGIERQKKKKDIQQHVEMDLKGNQERNEWTKEQLESLTNARERIRTSATNFWIEVAKYVPGKSATDCRIMALQQFTMITPNKRKRKEESKKNNLPTPKSAKKLSRAGTNRFKKQVREFVDAYEKKHMDDLFESNSPTKREIKRFMQNLDDIPSPHINQQAILRTPSRKTSRRNTQGIATGKQYDDDDDDEVESDEEDERISLLEKVTAAKRDQIDSYVLELKRNHRHAGVDKVQRSAQVVEPHIPNQKRRKTILEEEYVGSRILQASVSPGGTTKVRVERNESETESDEYLVESDVYSDSDMSDYEV